MMRLRSFVQDDGHIFCTKEQISSEVSDFIDRLLSIYKDFGFDDVTVKLSTRPEMRVGEDRLWDYAESSLEKSLNDKKLNWKLSPGEGAFYGPKIEFSLKDCLNRVWQLGTVQLDFSMPSRLGATYISSDNKKETPVMIHRAILGSIERFIGVLIEHYAGHLPLWLAPLQAGIIPITDADSEYVKNLEDLFKSESIRATADYRSENEFESQGVEFKENSLHFSLWSSGS